MTPPERRRRDRSNLVPFVLLAVAIAATSSSAVLVRQADAPAVALAFWRTAAGAALLAPAARSAARRARSGATAASAGEEADCGPPPPGRRRSGVPWAPVLVAGAALAVHFATWLASLDLTSVAASVTLVSTAPIFVALYLAGTGSRLGKRAAAAIALAVAGTAVIAGGDALAGGQSLAGDALALVGAAAMAAYLVAGTRARTVLSTAAYTSRAYAVAAAVLLPIVVGSGRPLGGYDGTTWLAIAGMVLGPQLLGHTLFNHLLSRLGAVTVSLALLVEPVGAATLTWLAFGEVPALTVWLGAPIVLAGLVLQTTGRAEPPRRSRRRGAGEGHVVP